MTAVESKVLRFLERYQVEHAGASPSLPKGMADPGREVRAL